MGKDFSTMEDSNRSSNPSIHDVSDPARRIVLRGGMGLAAALLGAGLGSLTGCAAPAPAGGGTAPTPAAPPRPRLGFAGVAASAADTVIVPAGYVTQVIAAWGEPVGVPGAMPAWRPDAGNTAAEQALQMGMHHDGLHYFALEGSRHGLLALNHEYVDDGLLHPDGTADWSAEKTAKAQAAHGISVIEVELRDGRWQMVRPSRYARRITATTPHRIAGPAAGHRLMQTAADPEGRTVLGTVSNCGAGMTPWGTYLSGEENFRSYFHTAD